MGVLIRRRGIFLIYVLLSIENRGGHGFDIRGYRTLACRAATAQATNCRHVRPIGTDGFATFSTRGTGLVGSELVGGTPFVCGFTAFTGDFTLFLRTHRGKAPSFVSSCLG
jgi:hypothetical protein